MKIILTIHNSNAIKGYETTLANLSKKGFEVQYQIIPRSFQNDRLPITRFINNNNNTVIEHGYTEGLQLIHEIDNGKFVNQNSSSAIPVY